MRDDVYDDVCVDKECEELNFVGYETLRCESEGIFKFHGSGGNFTPVWYSCCRGSLCNNLSGTELMKLAHAQSAKVLDQSNEGFVFALCCFSLLIPFFSTS